MSWFNSNCCFGDAWPGGPWGCLATWALWVLKGMTQWQKTMSSDGSCLGTLVFRYRWPILTAMVCCIWLPLMSGGMGRIRGGGVGGGDNLPNLTLLFSPLNYCRFCSGSLGHSDLWLIIVVLSWADESWSCFLLCYPGDVDL